MTAPRKKTFTTTDGKITLVVEMVTGKPMAWITVAAPDFQSQHQFAPGVEYELAGSILKEEEST